MVPCQVCGGLAIDPNGYCAQCGTYRGPVPVTAVPVTSAYPYSAPPAPPEPRRNPTLLPLLAALLGVLIVGIAIVVVLVVKKESHRGATATASSTVDNCVVGAWTVTDATLQWTVEGIGVVPMQAQNTSQVVTLNADGTAVDDYGHSVYQGTLGGHTYQLRVTGTVHYGFRTGNGTLTFLSPSASGAIGYYVDGAGPTNLPLSVSSDPVQYTCAGDKLTEHTAHYDATLTRQPR